MGWRLSLVRGRQEFLRDDALDIAGAHPSLGHGGGVHVELNRGSPTPHHVGLEVWWDVNDEGVAPGIHPGIDLLHGQWCGWLEAGWEQRIADAPGQR